MSDDNVLPLPRTRNCSPRAARSRTVSLRRMPKKQMREYRALDEGDAREDAALGLGAPPTRPLARAGCLVCPSCQAWRDSIRGGGEPAERPCGHDADEAIARSRPCVFVSCSMNLFLDVIPPRSPRARQEASIKYNRPDVNGPEDLGPHESCAMDVADSGGATLQNVGVLLNLTRERARQMEEKALARLRALSQVQFLKGEMIDGPERYHLPVVREEPAEREDIDALRQALDRKFPDLKGTDSA